MADSNILDSVNDFPQIAPFDPTKKKKKKKKQNKVVICHHTDDSVHSLVDRADVLSCNSEGDEEEDGLSQQSRYPWEGSERDYQYKELLRIFSFMHKNSPELAGDRRIAVLRPPQILSEGAARTVFVNFMDICKTMYRPPEHVKAFMLKELGTIGSLDGESRLAVKGRFAPTSFEYLLQRYINEYVRCNCCGSPDTILADESQIPLLQCEMCSTERSVLPINVGYGIRLGRKKILTNL